MREKGFTLLEVLITIALLLILAAATIPVAKTSMKRQREMELRAALRVMRDAIDEYKRYFDQGLIQKEGLTSEGYPPDLETLVEGVNLVGQIDKKARFLRRIPKDPMTSSYDWGLRSLKDDHDAKSWGGDEVYDIYTQSEGVALDGTEYRNW